jgi:hypothetical protein
MSDIPEHSIDMILCDLPYGTTQCKWDSTIPFDKLWFQYKRIIKHGGAIVLFGAQPFTSTLICSNVQMFKYSWVWEKSKATGFLNAKRRPLVAHEDIVVFCDGAPPYYPIMAKGTPYDKGLRKEQTSDDVYGKFGQAHIRNETGLRYPRSVIYFKTAESEGKTYHKTQKPVALLEYLISTYTKDEEIVLDNCMGSGSTGVAALNLNRRFIGIELDATYCDIAKKRILDVVDNIA